MKKKYRIKFQDCFSFAIETKECELTDEQYASALKSKKAKAIVASPFDGHIHWNFFIKSISLIKN